MSEKMDYRLGGKGSSFFYYLPCNNKNTKKNVVSQSSRLEYFDFLQKDRFKLNIEFNSSLY